MARQRWDQAMIAESVALPRGEVGPYQPQAAIAAVHDETATMDGPDWPQILGLYDLLELAAARRTTSLPRASLSGPPGLATDPLTPVPPEVGWFVAGNKLQH